MSAETIYDAFVAAGMTPEGACAMLGNMQAESAMRADNAQDVYGIPDGRYTAEVDAGTRDFLDGIGYGLCQWTLSSRKKKLLSFAGERGVSIGNEQMQTQFAIRELREDFPGVWKQLTTARDLPACTRTVCEVYENPAVKNTSTRLAYAQSFHAALAGRTAAAAETARPVDPTVLAFQLWMNHNGYETPVNGRKSGAFFAKLREFVDDMEVC